MAHRFTNGTQRHKDAKIESDSESLRLCDSATLDVLIALHACNTATDDAIIKGIESGAKLIICAPCCHKQIRQEMEKSKVVDPITRYGIFLERQAVMITDAIRALIMEYYGYKTQVMEFIERIGLFILFGLMILAFSNDIMRFFF